MDGVARVQTALGPVDVLVNHDCLTGDPLRQVLTTMSSPDAMDGELDGCFNMCRAVLEGMRRRHFGRIVNISSVNDWPAQRGCRPRDTGRSGMIGLTRSLAYECAAHNITANAIAPGQTDTAMMSTDRPVALTRILASVPAGRLATPAEVARGVVLLVADESAFINGVTLSMDGAGYVE
jgi:acetoacetyl-CoA reductase